jgi:hypothetical protein
MTDYFRRSRCFDPTREDGTTKSQRWDRFLEVLWIRRRLFCATWRFPPVTLLSESFSHSLPLTTTNCISLLNFIRQCPWGGYYSRHPDRVDAPPAIALDWRGTPSDCADAKCNPDEVAIANDPQGDNFVGCFCRCLFIPSLSSDI